MSVDYQDGFDEWVGDFDQFVASWARDGYPPCEVAGLDAEAFLLSIDGIEGRDRPLSPETRARLERVVGDGVFVPVTYSGAAHMVSNVLDVPKWLRWALSEIARDCYHVLDNAGNPTHYAGGCGSHEDAQRLALYALRGQLVPELTAEQMDEWRAAVPPFVGVPCDRCGADVSMDLHECGLPDPCRVSLTSSRGCHFGTRGCEAQHQSSPGHDPAGAGTPVGEPTTADTSGGRARRPEPQQPANADYQFGSSWDGKSGAVVGEQGTGEPGGVVGAAGRPPHGRFRHAVARVALDVYYWGLRSPRKGKADRAEYIRVLTLTVAYQAAWAARHGIDFRTFVPEVYAAVDESKTKDGHS